MDVRPLEGLRVVDLTRALSGPYATALLAGLGAHIIKVEDPRGGDLARDNAPYVGRDGLTLERRHADDVSISHLTRARGKYGVTLNLKHAEAREVFHDLVAVSDIVVENFTSGTADRLGVGYAAAREANPRVIYCSISGFGATSGDSGKAMDIIVQALSGVMLTSGSDGDPPVRIGTPLADMLAPLFGIIGILAALEQRHRTGVGQYVDVSMLGALTSFVAIENWAAMREVGLPTRSGLRVQRLSPFGAFRCRDGYVALVAVHDALAEGLFRAIGRPELIRTPQYATRDARVANAHELEHLIEAWSSALTTAEAIAALEREGVPAARVRAPEEALADPRVVARGETVAVSHPTYPDGGQYRTAGVPIVFSAARTGNDEVVPVAIGEHNALIYGGLLGYDAARIAMLRERGII